MSVVMAAARTNPLPNLTKVGTGSLNHWKMDLRAKFLREAACVYSEHYPALSSHLGSQLFLHLPKCLQNKLLCSRCSLPLTPNNSSTRTLTSYQLRRRRRRGLVRGVARVVDLNKPEIEGVAASRPRKWRLYVVAHCRHCHHTTVLDGLPRPPTSPGPMSHPSDRNNVSSGRSSMCHTPSGHGTPRVTTPCSLLSSWVASPTPLPSLSRSLYPATPTNKRQTKMLSASPLTGPGHTHSPGISHTPRPSHQCGKKGEAGASNRKCRMSRKSKKRMGLKAALEQTDSFARARTSELRTPSCSLATLEFLTPLEG